MTDKEEIIKNKLNAICKYIGVAPEISIKPEDNNLYMVDISGNDLSFIIGYRGESLDALQNLVNQMIFKQLNEWVQVVIDINGYKNQKQGKIEQIAKRFIDKVRFLGHEVDLPPMEAYERRFVHMLLSQYDDVESESRGEGRNRRVVIKPKK
ncbi:hypothetical protein A3F07_02145 [candidate division WWE3 bacterium RIFCSPHIGHO2_12_FULL_38_15]|uniref:R3H domain-containing protein n=1 Tax=candidate division WWE3 bacterium RIFCSPHIGHO2_02_FULL_38_14 TaxID=1802620 RepID=A0A1F4V894_UNCKA|nr:MAG: hypothetical protein A2793_03380 [candidate division WWE3 bacterium RIFCSPHIGHO2_01_FULL_38_45]OGC48682.1 MAG: hypothetical protein A3F07_02145 [candidate division WWE3 bacterium RIFCSPHIGHO2_12_FULL_38_15]OGC53088.1 MAG: hypothetical protein A3B64_01405 [candidate division WWE3 bacterium RIFCSPLOWO2_01_FULL_37_24]OGC53451.1 MAG: hypothetical protein A3D91_00260 [candidate division WWE3 bacterium RIFCSPHIGHO2_02_FULL_38_14]HLB51926.1 R3H domain-containing nucleic acid-binding protein [P